MKTNGDQSAFARPLGSSLDGHFDSGADGLTKREYFAAMAMQGNLSACGPGSLTNDVAGLENMAIGWVQAADALIKELNKDTK